MKHQRNSGELTDKWTLNFLLALLVMAVIMHVLSLFVANNHLEDGTKLQIIDLQIAQVEAENEQLKEEIRHASSFVTIIPKAREMGFTERQVVIFLQKK